MEYATCTRCGVSIKEVYMIGGKPFGSTCAERELGIKFEPYFKGGNVEDYLENKKKRDAKRDAAYAKAVAEAKKARKRTKDNFELMRTLSLAFHRADSGSWLQGFVLSISQQIGIIIMIPYPLLSFDNYEDLYAEWESNLAMGDPYYLQFDLKPVSSLSPKQLAVLERNNIEL